MSIELSQGDCLELMKDIPDGSVDMILKGLNKMSEDKRKVRVLDDVKDGDAIIVNGKAFIYYKGEFIEGVKVAEKIALVLEGVTLRISEAMNNILNSLGDEWYE